MKSLIENAEKQETALRIKQIKEKYKLKKAKIELIPNDLSLLYIYY